MTTIIVDKNRILIKEASADKITGKWKGVVNEIIETYKRQIGSRLISVYIGGSVAHGTAIKQKSDVDAYAIVDITKEEINSLDPLFEKERARIDALFPFQRGVELHLIPLNQISEGKKFQMKVFAAHVYGKDFNEELPEYTLDKETLGRIRVNISKDIEIVTKELSSTDNSKEIQKISTWISKRLIRSSGVLCLWKEDFFTMDVEKLTELVIRHYPEKKGEVTTLFQNTKNPSSDKVALQNLLTSYGEWVIQEDEKVFGKKN